MAGWVVATNFNVSSRLGFKLWGLLPWLPSLADPCLTLAWASQKHGLKWLKMASIKCILNTTFVCWARPELYYSWLYCLVQKVGEAGLVTPRARPVTDVWRGLISSYSHFDLCYNLAFKFKQVVPETVSVETTCRVERCQNCRQRQFVLMSDFY